MTQLLPPGAPLCGYFPRRLEALSYHHRRFGILPAAEHRPKSGRGWGAMICAYIQGCFRYRRGGGRDPHVSQKPLLRYLFKRPSSICYRLCRTFAGHGDFDDGRPHEARAWCLPRRCEVLPRRFQRRRQASARAGIFAMSDF